MTSSGMTVYSLSSGQPMIVSIWRLPFRSKATLPDSLSRSLFLCAALWSLRAVGRPAILGSLLGVLATTTLSSAQSAVGWYPPAEGLTVYWRTSIFLPSTKTSILVRKKQSSASAGLHTTGSFSLKEVLRTIGTSVNSRNASISA
jgi:hypothetical protein